MSSIKRKPIATQPAGTARHDSTSIPVDFTVSPSTTDNTDDGLANELEQMTLVSPENSDFEDDILDDMPVDQFPAETQIVPSPTSTASQSKWQKAIENTSYFAGGLFTRPSISTKKYTILRHSYGLIYYHGPQTSIAITIFSRDPMPFDRTLWLQQKGWTGDTGMKMKRLTNLNSSWIDVTPTEIVSADRVPKADNRAWERDIRKFTSKKVNSKTLRLHECRETDVIRIPSEAQDGYFRIILCANGSKKALCASPIFRIASTSMSSGTFKGSNLKTLPLELAVKIGSTIVSNNTSTFTAPVTSLVQNQFGQYMPGFWTQEAGTVAYSATGAEEKMSNLNENYQNAREAAFDTIAGDASSAELHAVGNDAGPEAPYPVMFQARVKPGEGQDRHITGIPSANLGAIEDTIKTRLNGVYFGWILLSVSKTSSASVQDHDFDVWKQAIIIASPSTRKAASVVLKKDIKAYILHDFGNDQFFEAKANVMILGYLHQFQPYEPDQSSITHMRDITITQLSLARPAWTAEAVLERIKTEKKSKSFSDRYVDTRAKIQKQVDRVPLHRLGVRTDGMGIRDKAIGNGGFTILR